jgi:hypothetical protein
MWNRKLNKKWGRELVKMRRARRKGCKTEVGREGK